MVFHVWKLIFVVDAIYHQNKNDFHQSINIVIIVSIKHSIGICSGNYCYIESRIEIAEIKKRKFKSIVDIYVIKLYLS